MKIQETDLITLEEALASSQRQMVERFSKHVSPIEARIFKLLNTDKRFVKAEGIRIFDEQGEEYLDFTGGYGALSLGHNPTEVLDCCTASRQSANNSFFLCGYPSAGRGLG